MPNNKKQIYIFLVLIALILIAIYPFSLFIYVPKWDSMSGYLPYRYFNSDYLHSGNFPFWNPFQRFGYPAYSDLQSGLWYPPVWLLMLTGKYTITQLIIEQILVFIIAGIGMFIWIKDYLNCAKTAFVAAISYALSGFMFGSNHLLVFTIGYAWFPYSIYAFYRYYQTFKVRYILLNTVFIALTITGASPAYSIVLVYIFLGLYLFLFFKIRSDSNAIKTAVKHGFMLIFLVVTLTLPYILSFYDFMPFFNRMARLPYEEFVLNPLTFPNFLSFFFPYTVVSGDDWFHGTDLSLRNLYIGFLPGILFFVAIFRFRKDPRLKLWLLFIGVFIVLSLGDELFIYRFIYEMPGFGLFRHPSFFRGYVIFGVITIVGFLLKKLWSDEASQKHFKKLIYALIPLIFLLVCVAWFQSGNKQIIQLKSEILSLTEFSSLTLMPHLFLNSLIVFVILILFLLVNFKLDVFRSFVFCLWIDLGVQITLAIPSTLCFTVPFSDVKSFFNALPDRHNQEFNQLLFKELNDSKSKIHTKAIWENKPVFEKYPASSGVNPFRFKSYDEAKNSGDLNYHLENPLFYFPQTNQKLNQVSPGQAWNVQTEIVSDSLTEIKDMHVGYNSFSATVTNESNVNGLLILNQNYHDLWKAFLNQREIKIFRVSDMVMGVKIPPGQKMNIEFKYKSEKIYFAAILSFVTWILIIFGFSKLYKSKI